MIEDKYIGLALAVTSTLAIGTSFVITKKGLNRAAEKHEFDGTGFAYLKTPLWWAGIITMVIGEIANFAAYAFAPAILVTPLGALSVLIGAVLGSYFLGEQLGVLGRIGCAICLVGSVVIVLHAPPDTELENIDQLLHYALGWGFLFYCAFVSIFAVVMIYKIAPKYGKKNPMIYLSICSSVGSISVMAIKGFGVAVKMTLSGNNQFTHASTYVFVVAVAVCILTQMNYFNKALSQFSTNIVNPLYYVTFTTCTLIASFVLFSGFNTSDAVNTISLLCGFLTIFTGVYLLNLSREDPNGENLGINQGHYNKSSANGDADRGGYTEVDGIPTDGLAGGITRLSMQSRRSGEFGGHHRRSGSGSGGWGFRAGRSSLDGGSGQQHLMHSYDVETAQGGLEELAEDSEEGSSYGGNGKRTSFGDGRVKGPSVTDTLTPKVRLPKKLIVCCDGTWLDSDNGWVKGKWGKEGHPAIPSNVTRISRAIASEDDDHHPQIVYYQAGVGTGIGLYSQLMGGGTGLGLAENIREAYSFLASNYSEHEKLAADHDSIFLIGFSRGAFTARSLGGFIGAVGILKKDAMAHFYEIFTDWENAGSSNYTPTFFDSYFSHPEEYMPEKVKPDSKLASDPSRISEYMDEYRRLLLDLSLTQEANVKIIGVWDTVGALGIPVNPLLQRLLPFLPAFVREYSWFDTTLDNHIEHAFQALALDERRFPYSPAIWEKPAGNTTNLKQCWFAGAHSNIGGSYEDTGMADITLAWMMDQLAGHSTYPSDKELSPDSLPFRPLDWIKFDHPYISHLYHQQTKYYAHHGGGSRGWGMGRVYDSLTLPQSLVGAKTRVPGRYHRTFYHPGKIDPKRPLHNTNEYIHAFVRARLDFGGNGYEPQDGLLSKASWFWHRLTSHAVGAYKPQRPGGPLDGWVVQDGREYHDCPNDRVVDLSSEPPERAEGVKWVYSGKHAVQNSVMFEDRLGDFEKLLLQKEHLPGGAPVVGNGWSGFRGMLELMGRKAQTF